MSDLYPMKAVPGYYNSKPGIQVGTKLQGQVTYENGKLQFDEDGINFLKQIGVEWVMVGDRQVPEHSAECYAEIKDELAKRGLKVYRIANNRLHNMSSVTLNLPDRDEYVEEYLQYIWNLGKAGIHYATYAHMGNGIWRGDFRREVRGHATAGGLDLEQPNRSRSFGSFNWPLSHGREYSEEELWENYKYFIKKVVPVAEESGVFIGIHPDDPPVYTMAGVPRCIFGNFEGYKRALELANSPNIGCCLCVGCWLEGGTKMGATVEEFIRWLAERKLLFKVHMRNVTAPLDAPGGFNETFPDAGYYNLIRVMKTLKEVNFDGCIMNDHLLDMVGGRYTCEAYCTAYLKGVADTLED